MTALLSQGVPFVLDEMRWNRFRSTARPRQFPPEEMPATLCALLEKLGIAAATVVAEVDGQIVTTRAVRPDRDPRRADH